MTKFGMMKFSRVILDNYDWLHLHHEDFTGQYGKFYASFASAQWYIDQQLLYEQDAKKNGFKKVSEMMKAVSIDIKNYVGKGGFLFAMCSATDSYDIALSAINVDICEQMYDGDAADPNAQQKLNFDNTLAFTNFNLEMNPYVYEYSDIDIQPIEVGNFENDYFTLFEFSAKYDPVPTMLTQCHANIHERIYGADIYVQKKHDKKFCYHSCRKKWHRPGKIHSREFWKGNFHVLRWSRS